MRFSFLKEEIKSLKYYGSGDLAGGIFVKNVVNELEALESNVSELNDDIVEVEDLFRYLWILSFHEMVLEIDKYSLNVDIKIRIKELDKLIDYSPKRFIKYINKNFAVALDKTKVNEVRWYEFYDILMDLIFNKYSSGIHYEVFEFIEQKFALNILAYFNKYSNYYSKHKESVKKLFVDLEKTNVFDDQVYTSFLLNNKIEDDFYTKKAKFICERSIKYIKSLKFSTDSKDIYQIDSLFVVYRNLAIIYNLKCANEYNEYMFIIENTMNEYLKKHAHHIDLGPIDFEVFISELKNSNEDWKFLQLTHFSKNKKFYNNLNRIFEEKPKSVLGELVNRIGVAKSEKYPYSSQDMISLNLQINSQIIYLILADQELSKQFYEYVFNLANVVQKDYFSNSINIDNEICGIFELIESMLDLLNNKQEETYLYKALVNGCALNACCYIEKMLRNIAFHETKEKAFFDQESNTLGYLLKYHKYKALSEGLLYYLEFYLSKENNDKLRTDERPGKNIRNIQMHNYDKKYERTNLNLCLELFYFVLSILGDLLIECANQNSKKDVVIS